MEHLMLPRYRPTKELIVIPYVCDKPYDHGEFLSYPIRENIRFAILATENDWPTPYGKHLPKSTGQVHSLLQTWLFFGLINEILGKYINANDLIRDTGPSDAPVKVLSTAAIPDAVQRLVEDVKAKPEAALHSYDHVALCLRLTFTNLKEAATEIRQDWLLQLASLAEMFCWAVNRAYDKLTDPYNENKCPNQWHSLINRGYWEGMMVRSDLCPSQRVMTLKMASSVHTLYFASNMIQHTPPGAHNRCGEDFCKAQQIDLARYLTKHVSADCKCKHFSIDPLDLTRILRSGHLPLLRIRPDRLLERLGVDVVSSKDVSRYLALSHVWADGLGNPVENSLPGCQLNFLYDTLEKFKGQSEVPRNEEMLIWCDTLCCPARQGDGKTLALKELKRTYLEASYVLVLDSSIRHFDLEDMEIDEAAMRILTSGWYRRLWTLQEAALSIDGARLWFYFKKSFLHIRPLLRGISKHFSSVISRNALANDLVARCADFLTFFDPNNEGVDFESIAIALQFRSVTVKEDEPLLIGNLLSLDVAEILEHTTLAKRMEQLWMLIPQSRRGIPKAIIFWIGPKLNFKGFRWAPASVLFHSSQNSLGRIDSPGSPGLLTERGLVVTFPGYKRIGLPNRTRLVQHVARNVMKPTLRDFSWARRDDGSWFRLVSGSIQSLDNMSPEDDIWAPLTVPNLRLVHMSLPATNWDYKERGSGEASGILATEEDTQDDVIFVRTVSTVSFSIQIGDVAIVLEAAHTRIQEFLQSSVQERLLQLEGEYPETNETNVAIMTEFINETITRAVDEMDLAILDLASKNGADGKSELRELLQQMFVGNYCLLGQQCPETQKWCVD